MTCPICAKEYDAKTHIKCPECGFFANPVLMPKYLQIDLENGEEKLIYAGSRLVGKCAS